MPTPHRAPGREPSQSAPSRHRSAPREERGYDGPRDDRPQAYRQQPVAEPQDYSRRTPSGRGQDDAPGDATVAFGLNKNEGAAARTEANPPQQRTAPATRPRPSSERTQSGARPGRRSGHLPGLQLGPKAVLWACAGIAAFAAVAVVALILFRSGPGGPAHTLVTPSRLGAFTRSTQLTKQMNVSQLERNIVTQSSGQASHLVSAVYQAGSPVAGGSPAQVMLFIGGQLSGASPDASVKSFTQHFKDASMTSAGSLGGEAACVSAQSGGTGGSTVCAWFDNNTFGELVSPNMTVSALASELRTIRPSVEHVVKN